MNMPKDKTPQMPPDDIPFNDGSQKAQAEKKPPIMGDKSASEGERDESKDFFMSETIGKISEALSAVQGEVKPLQKDSRNPHIGNNYASLGVALSEALPLLAKNGLSLFQTPTLTKYNGDPVVRVVSLLMHKSGEYIGGAMMSGPGRVSKGGAPTDPQPLGAAITYLRRYLALAQLGLAPEDDDGHSANSGGEGRPSTSARPSVPRVQKPSDQLEAEGFLKTKAEILKNIFNASELDEIMQDAKKHIDLLESKYKNTRIRGYFEGVVKARRNQITPPPPDPVEAG